MVMHPRIQMVNRPGAPHTGIGRYVAELERGLRERSVDVRRAQLRSPVPGPLQTVTKRIGYDLETFFASYPVRADARRGYLTHLTSQTLGTLLFTQRLPRPVVITVHDILPYLLRGDPKMCMYRNSAQRVMDTLAMRGLKRADRLIANSHYTKSTLINELCIEADKIDVVHFGVDSSRFRPLDVPESIRSRYHIPADRPYVLYVGSEDPRKNLPLLLRAMQIVRNAIPDVTLLKVGSAAFEDQRAHHEQLSAQLGLGDAVRWIDDVPEEDLPFLYNAATVFAFPSLYEGFGFPIIEAMACGTQVVATRIASVSEIAEDAVLWCQSNDAEDMARQVLTALRADESSQDRLQAGLARSRRFSWDDTVRKTIAYYRMTLMNQETVRILDRQQHDESVPR